MKPIFWAALAFACVAACGESPGKAWLVDRPRVLGARFEGTEVDWLVPAPGAPRRLGWSFATCVAPRGNFAAPRCEGAIATSGSGTSEGDEARMDVGTLPDAALVLAAFCEGDVPATFDPRSFEATCASGAEPLLASAKSPLPGNKNPAVADAAVAVPQGCVQPGGAEEQLLFRFEDEQREAGETLLVATFVTGGELERTYSSLEPDEPAPKTVSVGWKPPETEGDVRSFFVLRDGRGGTTFVRRTLCVRR